MSCPRADVNENRLVEQFRSEWESASKESRSASHRICEFKRYLVPFGMVLTCALGMADFADRDLG